MCVRVLFATRHGLKQTSKAKGNDETTMKMGREKKQQRQSELENRFVCVFILFLLNTFRSDFVSYSHQLLVDTGRVGTHTHTHRIVFLFTRLSASRCRHAQRTQQKSYLTMPGGILVLGAVCACDLICVCVCVCVCALTLFASKQVTSGEHMFHMVGAEIEYTTK